MITTIYVDGVSAVVAKSERLTSGRVGMQAALILDSETWAGLDCLVSVRGSGVVRNVPYTGVEGEGVYAGRIIGSVTIPHDCMSQAYSHLQIGIRGVKEVDGVTVEVIPSIYCDLGVIEQGASDAGEGDSDYEKTLIEQLLAAAQNAQSIAQSVRDDADDGKFNGEPGPQGPGYTITEADYEEIASHVQAGVDGKDGKDGVDGKDGKDGVDGKDGKDGVDGVSPTVQVTAITGGHRVAITDAAGTQNVDVMDGSPGKDGKDGDTGAQGVPGNDGVSPTVAIQAVENGYTITITDATGPHTYTVHNGDKGEAGSDYTITQADYQAIADVVLDSLDNADGEGF